MANIQKLEQRLSEILGLEIVRVCKRGLRIKQNHN